MLRSSFPRTARGLARSALAGLALMAGAAACGRDDRVPETDTSAAAGVIDSMPGAAVAAVAATLTDENVFALLDTAYAAVLQTDRLAVTKASDARVKAFATAAVGQDTLNRRGIETTIERLQIRTVLPDRDVIKDHQDRMAELQGKSGKEFDAAYLSHAVAMRKGLLDEVDDALENQNRQEPAVKYLRELKTTLEGELKDLEALRPAKP
jgi:predicted outer membrane protein